MVYISKVYTRSGDEGQTSLADGSRAPKDAQRVGAYGDVDELNATIGLARTEIARSPGDAQHTLFLADLDGHLARIQQELFNLGAELAHPGAAEGKAKLMVEQRHVDRLERDIDGFNEDLEPLKSFVLPGGGPVAASLHVCRTVCRRAERNLVSLAATDPVRGEAVRYLNRLSDYLFVASRAAAGSLGHDEVLWDPATV
jgi:cob(I)alamin adenosyltransferase